MMQNTADNFEELLQQWTTEDLDANQLKQYESQLPPPSTSEPSTSMHSGSTSPFYSSVDSTAIASHLSFSGSAKSYNEISIDSSSVPSLSLSVEEIANLLHGSNNPQILEQLKSVADKQQ